MLFREPSKADMLIMKGVLGSIGRVYYKRYVYSLGFKDTDRIIDYGSGPGIAACYLARAVYKGHVTCVDRSVRWLEMARKTLQGFDNVDLMQGDIESIDIPDGTYDNAFIHFVLHDIDAGERKAKVLALARKLKKGGRIYLGEPAASNHGMSLEDMNELMGKCGLRMISSHRGRMLLLGKVNYGIYEN